MRKQIERPIRVLITGFGPFPGVTHNTSERLVRHLSKMTPVPGLQLHSRVLPTSWQRAIGETQRVVRDIQPHAILHFGVAKRAIGFEIEMVARNAIDGRMDNDNCLCRSQVCVPGKPYLRHATIPAPLLLQRLKSQGYQSCLSKDAGRYICNNVLYTSLNASHGANIPLVGFIHIPVLTPHKNNDVHLNFDELVNGARILIFTLREAVSRHIQKPSQLYTKRKLHGTKKLPSI